MREPVPDGGRPQPDPFPVGHRAATDPAPLRVVVADDNPVVRAGLTSLLSGRQDIHVVAEAEDGRAAYEAARAHPPDIILLDVRMPGVDGISALPYLKDIAPVMMLTYSQEDVVVQEALRLGAGGYLVHGEFTADQLVAAVRDVRAGRPYFTASPSHVLLSNLRVPREPGNLPVLDGSDGGVGHHPNRMPSPSVELPHAYHVAGDTGVTPGPRAADRDYFRSPWEPNGVSSASVPRPAVAGTEPPDRAMFALSDREGEVMELIATGMSNAQIAATCFISEKTVKNHINRIFAKLHAGSRSEAVALWLGMARGVGGGHV